MFNIILKVIGIFFVKELLLLLPQLLSAFVYLTEGARIGGWFILFSVIITIAIYLLIIFYFVLDTDVVIDRFELTKGIEEENLAINVHRSTVLNIVILLVGIVMIVTVLPSFLQSVFTYFQEKRLADGLFSEQRPNASRMILYGSELLLAIIIVVYKNVLVNYIELKRRNKSESNDLISE